MLGLVRRESTLRWGDLSLLCPQCRAPLELDGFDQFDCSRRHTYPIISGDSAIRFGGVVRPMVPGLSGRAIARPRSTPRVAEPIPSDSFAQKVGLGPAELDGRLVLDVGVGSSHSPRSPRESRRPRRCGSTSSRAVDAAAGNLGDRALVAQADLFNLPFADGTFDVVYSIGVLHHTPDTAAAVRALAPIVKPGGTLAVWVYRRAVWYRMADLYRHLTTRMSDRSLYRLSRVLARLYPLQKLPVVGRPLRFLVPVSGQADY